MSFRLAQNLGFPPLESRDIPRENDYCSGLRPECSGYSGPDHESIGIVPIAASQRHIDSFVSYFEKYIVYPKPCHDPATSYYIRISGISRPCSLVAYAVCKVLKRSPTAEDSVRFTCMIRKSQVSSPAPVLLPTLSNGSSTVVASTTKFNAIASAEDD